MTPTIHGTCVCVGENGVLIRGASGAGKSALAIALVETAQARGLFASLVADDRVVVEAANGRVIASPPAELAGMIERRGVGVVRTPHLAAAIIRLVADIGPPPPRMPEEGASAEIAGVIIPLLAIAAGDAGAVSTILHALSAIRSTEALRTGAPCVRAAT